MHHYLTLPGLMIRLRYACFVAILALLHPSIAHANSEGVFTELSQGCYAIKAPIADLFLTHDPDHSDHDGYRFQTADTDPAMAFFFKRVGPDAFLLRDTQGKGLDFSPTHPPTQDYPWIIEPSVNTGGSAKLDDSMLFRFTSAQGNRRLGLSASGDLTFETGTAPEQQFELHTAQNCNPYQEVTTNVVGDRSVLQGDVNTPVRGWIDAHTHITSFMSMASVVFHGKPYDERGPAASLGDSFWIHGHHSYNDLVGRVLKGDFEKRKTDGWPNFPDWPTYEQLSYSLYHYRWLERAYLSGQRLMVTHLVENEVLCYVANALNIYRNPRERTGCNPRNSIKDQARYMWELQDAVDEQFGGPGSGFFAS